jgi:hypothetical protein
MSTLEKHFFDDPSKSLPLLLPVEARRQYLLQELDTLSLIQV